jgi:hypothetical protein
VIPGTGSHVPRAFPRILRCRWKWPRTVVGPRETGRSRGVPRFANYVASVAVASCVCVCEGDVFRRVNDGEDACRRCVAESVCRKHERRERQRDGKYLEESLTEERLGENSDNEMLRHARGQCLFPSNGFCCLTVGRSASPQSPPGTNTVAFDVCY